MPTGASRYDKQGTTSCQLVDTGRRPLVRNGLSTIGGGHGGPPVQGVSATLGIATPLTPERGSFK